MDRSYPGHALALGGDRNSQPDFRACQDSAGPIALVTLFKAGFSENRIEVSHSGTLFQKQSHGFAQASFRFGDRIAATGDIQLRRIRDIRAPLFLNIHGEPNVQHLRLSLG
jgi:hypothetical protein